MRDDVAFLRAIIDNPDDDLPRLVYADYLDERGDRERAEFIRIQCELARLSEDAPRRAKLVARAELLLGVNRLSWLGSLSEFVDDCSFRRGFVERVGLSAAAFVAHAETIWQWAPVRYLDLREDAWEEIDKLAVSPYLGRLNGLSLMNNHLESDDVVTLLKSPHLARLSELNLGQNRLDLFAVQALAGCPSLTNLQTLVLFANVIGSDSIVVLAESPFFKGLTGLDIAGTSVGPAGVEQLAVRDGLPNLTVLDLSHNRIGRRGERALIHGSGLQHMRSLLLRGIPITPDVRAALERRFGPGVCDFG